LLVEAHLETAARLREGDRRLIVDLALKYTDRLPGRWFVRLTESISKEIYRSTGDGSGGSKMHDPLPIRCLERPGGGTVFAHDAAEIHPQEPCELDDSATTTARIAVEGVLVRI
jgi:hypothetical protein